jgi:carbonic anhydrase
MNARASRRDWLKLGAATVAAMASAPVSGLAQDAVPPFPMPKTPADAMKLLQEGNQRFQDEKLTSCSVNLAILRQHSETKQVPFAAILSCADSRVPAELLFDQSLGHLFVVRVAGNIATPDTIGSLEYGAAVLKVKTILVLGHKNCGAVKATMDVAKVEGQISTLYQYIYPATVGEKDLSAAVNKNVQLQATTLRDASPVLKGLVAAGEISIVAAVYDVGTGVVTLL